MRSLIETRPLTPNEYPSERDLAAAEDCFRHPERKQGWPTRVTKRFAPGAAALVGVVAFGGCAPQSPAVGAVASEVNPATPTTLPTREATATPNPTATRRAIITPVPLGAVMPEACKGNPAGERGWQKATDKQRPLTEKDEPDIEAFNECAAITKSQAEARQTAEAAKPTAIATEVPKPPPIVTPAILETATPEAKYRFATYGVYVGEVEGGGTVLFSTLPDGTLVFESLKQQPRCSLDYYMFFFGDKGKYQPDGKFAFKRSAAMEVTGELVDENTVVGKMLEKGHTAGSPKGPVICEKTEVGFIAKQVGTGRTALLEAKRNQAVATGFPKPTLERALMQLEAECNCKLPD